MLLVWGFFPLIFNNLLIIFSCTMSWCSYGIAEREIHTAQLNSEDTTCLMSLSAEWERQTCLESESRIEGLSLTNSIPEELSGRWLWDRRLKSSVYPLWIPLSLFHFYWLITYFLSLFCWVFFLPALLSACDPWLYLLPTVQTLLWGQRTRDFPFYLRGGRVVLFSLY